MNIFTLFDREQILFQLKCYKEPLMFLIMECYVQVIVKVGARLNPVLASVAV